MRLFLIITLSSLYTQIFAQDIVTGAERTTDYFPVLYGKKVALVVNQTSVIGETHLVDSLQTLGISIVKIFAPEHGFRGTADAGEHIKNDIDEKSKLPVISLYGKKYAPDSSDLKNVDVLIFDIQDVGCRFYTFISTLHYVAEACAENSVKMLIFDRPNPNGYIVDGPILKRGWESFVGVDRIPVMHGLTVGEYAKMLVGEKWIKNAEKLDLIVVPCNNYAHAMLYPLPIKPSPNLPNEKSVELYPSLCFFEGTNVSVGRGTDFPFQIIGSNKTDKNQAKFEFKPEPREGANEPFLKGKDCFGFDLRNDSVYGINVNYLLKMYALSTDKEHFFLPNLFFDRLAGSTDFREQIIAGKTAEEIKTSWASDLNEYKEMRKKYLLYP